MIGMVRLPLTLEFALSLVRAKLPIPVDAVLVGARVDMDTGAKPQLILTIASTAFPPVQEGNSLPRLDEMAADLKVEMKGSP